ncbi:MAG: hypothetical protein Q9206_007315 [Seirophora lacunosa]|nr:MAG: hypothetical protein LQ344_001355 [Seirophora lacunosa]
MWQSYLICLQSTLAMILLCLQISTITAYPQPDKAHLSKSLSNIRLLHYSAQHGDISGQLEVRGPHDRGQVVEMRYLQFKALAAIVPIAPAARALYVHPHISFLIQSRISPFIIPFKATRPDAEPKSSLSEEFYQGIAAAAQNEWASQPRLPGFMYSEGGFALAMQSWGDTIPWDFVFAMANRLWMCAAQGLPYLFDLAYASPDGKILVSITLRLAAEAVSSLVNSNGLGSVPSIEGSTPNWAYDPSGLPGDDAVENWREGSVPSVNMGDPLDPR